MKVLIVFAHESRSSFNGALLDAAVQRFKDDGHEVMVSDLYGMNFNNKPSEHDITDGRQNKDYYDYVNEMRGALNRGTMAEDIVAEHKKLDAADLVIFQFPLSWYSWPAILKGWIDRIMVNGYSYSYFPEFKVLNLGPFNKKKAIISLTTGGFQSTYTETGLHGDINIFLWPMLMTLYHMGFIVLPPQLNFSVKFATDEQRKEMISSWQKRLQKIWIESPLKFFNFENFEMAKGLTLSDEALEKAKKGEKSPVVGQHLGLPLNTEWLQQSK